MGFCYVFCTTSLVCVGLLRLWLAGADPRSVFAMFLVHLLCLVGVRAVAIAWDPCGACVWLSRSADSCKNVGRPFMFEGP